MGRRGGDVGRTISRRGLWRRAWLPGRGFVMLPGKFGLIARHVSRWRGLARKGKLVLPCDGAPTFVPLVLELATPGERDTAPADTAVIRAEIAGAVLHVAAVGIPGRAAALAAALKRAL